MVASHGLRTPSSIEKENVLCSVVTEQKGVDGEILRVEPSLYLDP